LKRRYSEIDFTKIAACLSVIMIHVTATPAALMEGSSIFREILVFLNAVTLYAVPCFIFLSGLVLMLSSRGKSIDYIPFVKRRLSTVIIPYLGWSSVFYVTYALSGLVKVDLNSLFTSFVMGKANYHLYFIVIIVQLYVLFPLLKGMLERFRTPVAVIAVAAYEVLQLTLMPGFEYKDRFFTSYLTFFIAGMIVAFNYESFIGRLKPIMAVTSAVYVASLILWAYGRHLQFIDGNMSIAANEFIWPVFSLASSIMLVGIGHWITSGLSDDVKHGIERVSHSTFYVYLSHPLLLFVLGAIFQGTGFRNEIVIFAVNLVVLVTVCFYLSVRYVDYSSARRARLKAMNAAKRI
jgi:probable poly-beta-1,6-N-acetyl-D-glucosamine export protein